MTDLAVTDSSSTDSSLTDSTLTDLVTTNFVGHDLTAVFGGLAEAAEFAEAVESVESAEFLGFVSLPVLAALAVGVAAVLMGWPVGSATRRLRRIVRLEGLGVRSFRDDTSDRAVRENGARGIVARTPAAVANGARSEKSVVDGKARLAVPMRLVDSRVALLGGIVAVASIAAFAGGPVAGIVAATYGAMIATAVRAARVRRAEEEIRRAVEEFIAGLADDLRAGVSRTRAFGNGAEATTNALPAIVRSVFPQASDRLVGAMIELADSDEPGAVLRAAASPAGEPAGPMLRRLAAAIAVSEVTGAGLAGVLDLLAADLRSARRLRAERRSASAGATASARLLAILPLGGLAIGGWLTADPVTMLLHTPAGAACTLGALALQGIGLMWSGRLARPAEVSANGGGAS